MYVCMHVCMFVCMYVHESEAISENPWRSKEEVEKGAAEEDI